MRDSFDASCFLSGSAGSRPCVVTMDQPSCLIVSGDGVTADWPYEKLSLQATGDEKSYLLVTCPSQSDSPVTGFVIKDNEFNIALAAHTGSADRSFLLGFAGQTRSHTGRRWRNILIFFAVSAVVIAASWYAVTHLAAEWAARKMPVETEVKWGKFISAAIISDEKLIEKGPAVDALREIVASLTNSLPHNPGYPFDIFIADKSMVNAIALPGGQMVVYSGLLKKAESPDEVAAVIAHEIQHVLKRHVVKRAVNVIGGRAVLAIVLGGDVSTVAMGASELLEMSYGRDQEREADREGLKLLASAGYQPSAMVVFFERLQKEHDINIPEMISTHPDTAARIADIREMSTGLPANQKKPSQIDWQKVRNSL